MTTAALRGGCSGRGWNIYADLGNVLNEDNVATHYLRNVVPDDAVILFPGRRGPCSSASSGASSGTAGYGYSASGTAEAGADGSAGDVGN